MSRKRDEEFLKRVAEVVQILRDIEASGTNCKMCQMKLMLERVCGLFEKRHGRSVDKDQVITWLIAVREKLTDGHTTPWDAMQALEDLNLSSDDLMVLTSAAGYEHVMAVYVEKLVDLFISVRSNGYTVSEIRAEWEGENETKPDGTPVLKEGDKLHYDDRIFDIPAGEQRRLNEMFRKFGGGGPKNAN